jgi:D-alanyl-D-alanine carboxypeptidase
VVASARTAKSPRGRRTLLTGVSCAVLVLAPLSGPSPAWAHDSAYPAGAGSPARAGAWCESTQTTKQLDDAVADTLRLTGVPGVAVGVWGPHCRYEKAFGVADKATGAPMRTDFYSRIGSETKTFTVTGVLQLVDEGKVGLDDPIAKYVPGVPEGDRITLRQLARMQSGLFPYNADEDFGRALVTDPYRSWTPQELLSYSFRHPLDFLPGEGWEYSNTNTVLLGLVVEQVSGLPLPEYIRQRITEPLGLEHTFFPTDNSFPQPHPEGYTQGEDGTDIVATDFDPSWGWAAGAMISTLEDLRVWGRAVATGTLLSPATQAQRLQTVPSPDFAPGVGYGLGILNAEGWIGHNGSIPGYQNLTLYLPQQKTTLVVLLNSDKPAPGIAVPSSAFGTAITRVISPDHVFQLEAS